MTFRHKACWDTNTCSPHSNFSSFPLRFVFRDSSEVSFRKKACFTAKMSTVDSYGPASQTLTFLETEETDFGADTQGSEFDFNDFTLPSQTQTQDHHSQPLVNGVDISRTLAEENGLVGRDNAKKKDAKDLKVNQITKGVGELNFEDDEEEVAFLGKDLPPHACR